MCCWADLDSVSDHIACCLSKGLLKGVFLETYVTTSLAVCSFGNK